MHSYNNHEKRIRKEAASQAIRKTNRLIATRLNLPLPASSTPTAERNEMIEILRIYIGGSV